MIIAGTDEVGYGSIAGPILAVTVVLNVPDEEDEYWWPLEEVADSKQALKSRGPKRERLRAAVSEFIINNGGEVGFGIASVDHINNRGYAKAWDYALGLSLYNATVLPGVMPHLSIVDGTRQIDWYERKQRSETKADGRYFAVAAASIIAKLLRDDMMAVLAEEFPHYEWERNAGYGTKRHTDGILEYGLTRYHRLKACETLLNKVAPRRRPPGW